MILAKLPPDRRFASGWRRAARSALGCTLWFACGALALAQGPNAHYLQSAQMPPGAIGTEQLERGGPIRGYFQPVEIRAPQGALVSLAAEGQFLQGQEAPPPVGCLIGAVYRLRVTNIPQQTGAEVYPTLEVVNRTYPPRGQEWRFPIPIDISQNDLELALDGKFVTRVIYLEDPATALPIGEGERTQWFDVGSEEDPLYVADTLGRPVAVLRLGGRVPDVHAGPDLQFLFGCPPFLIRRPHYQLIEGVPVPTHEAPADAVLLPGAAPEGGFQP